MNWQIFGTKQKIQSTKNYGINLQRRYMDLIILNDGLYQLIPVTKKMLDGIVLTGEIDCFELCDILRLKLTGYVDTLNLHIMNDGSGDWIGCMCR